LDRKLSEVVEPLGWHSPRIWAFLESPQKRANQNLNLFMGLRILWPSLRGCIRPFLGLSQSRVLNRGNPPPDSRHKLFEKSFIWMKK
jgi:hypothetical protein